MPPEETPYSYLVGDYEFEIEDPDNWPEHHPWDDNYVPYIYSIDQYHNLKEKIDAMLAQKGVSEYECKRYAYLLRAIERDRRDNRIVPAF